MLFLQYKCFFWCAGQKKLQKSDDLFRGGWVCVCVEVSLRTACCCQKTPLNLRKKCHMEWGEGVPEKREVSHII